MLESVIVVDSVNKDPNTVVDDWVREGSVDTISVVDDSVGNIS